jgi:D-xylose transport system substrate-binding protein
MKMLNSKINYLVIITLCISMFSCKKHADLKIGFMFPYTTGSRMAIETKYFKARAAELNCEVLVTDAKSDEQLQRTQAQELIQNGIDALVIMAVNSNTAAEIVRDAHNSGIKVIAYDRIINNCDLDFYISHNNYNVGKYMAEYALRLKPEGNYFMLGGDKSDRNAIFVKTGQLDAIKNNVQSGKIKIVFDVFIEEWSTENAYFVVKNYLKLSSNTLPDVILSSYDGLSYGSNRAFEELGLDYSKIVITGQDAEPQALRNIIAGKQTMTIFKPLKILAENAVEIAVKLVKHQKIDNTTTINNNKMDVPTILFDPIVVDKSNIKETVVKEGLVKESDLYGK